MGSLCCLQLHFMFEFDHSSRVGLIADGPHEPKIKLKKKAIGRRFLDVNQCFKIYLSCLGEIILWLFVDIQPFFLFGGGALEMTWTHSLTCYAHP